MRIPLSQRLNQSVDLYSPLVLPEPPTVPNPHYGNQGFINFIRGKNHRYLRLDFTYTPAEDYIENDIKFPILIQPHAYTRNNLVTATKLSDYSYIPKPNWDLEEY